MIWRADGFVNEVNEEGGVERAPIAAAYNAPIFWNGGEYARRRSTVSRER